MSSPIPGKRRMDKDVINLIQHNHEVTVLGPNEFCVRFHGPPATVYRGGVWKVRVYLTENYPFRSPSIGFMNRIFHPNIDADSGSVCLDVINQTWTPVYDLLNIFDAFLPQLLSYPNPSDPLNSEASMLYLLQPEEFEKKVQEHIRMYATEEVLRRQQNDNGSDSESESSLSDLAEGSGTQM